MHLAILEKVLFYCSKAIVPRYKGQGHRWNVKKEEERNVAVETYPLLRDCVLLRNGNYTGRDNINLIYTDATPLKDLFVTSNHWRT